MTDSQQNVSPETTEVFDTAVAAEQIAEAAWSLKALHLRVLDVQKIVSYADYLIVCHATSDRHASAIGDAIAREMRPTKYRPIGIEGKGGGDWMLMDFGDVVVHVFSTVDARRAYNLDSIYVDAPRLELDAPADLEDTEAMSAPRNRRAPTVELLEDPDFFDDL